MKLIPFIIGLLFVPQIAFGALADSLVSYWKMDESSGTAADSVGSNTLTNNGSAVFTTGKINNAVTAVRNTDYMSITDGSQSGLDITSSFTINMWVNWTALSNGNWNGMVSKFSNSGPSYATAILRDGSTYYITLRIHNGTTDYYNLQTITAPSTGVWIMYTFVFDASANTADIYANTSNIYARTDATIDPQNAGAEFRVGWFNNDDSQNGSDALFDEVSIWSRALTTGEITSLYNGGDGCAYPFSACESAVSATTILDLIKSFWW